MQMTTAPSQAIVDLLEGATLAQAAYVAAELHLADHLAGGPMRVNELALATRCHLPSLHRLLRALVTLEICVEQAEGVFGLGRSGSILCGDNADSLQSRLLWFGRNQWAAWGQLLQTVRTGESARRRMTGSDGFGMLELDPSAASTFNTAMVQRTRLVAKEVARHHDFSGVGTIVDVGGGYGVLLEAILRTNPGVRGVLFDRPHAVAGARALVEQAGIADRCELVPGDFFEALTAGADIYLLKNIIHDWDDERASRILRNCHAAMPDGGHLLLIEHVLPYRLNASASHRAIVHADLAMMLGPGGMERNESEFRELLMCSGLALAGVKPIGLGYSILEARKA
jgi:orsellinic acid C2-O-methyltransferase